MFDVVLGHQKGSGGKYGTRSKFYCISTNDCVRNDTYIDSKSKKTEANFCIWRDHNVFCTQCAGCCCEHY